MKYPVILAAVLATSLTSLQAQAGARRHDAKLEEAAARIVAAKIGDIREGFDIGEKPVIYSRELVRKHSVRGGVSLGSFKWANWEPDRK